MTEGSIPISISVWEDMSVIIHTIRVEIRGRVQGVYYRAWTVNRATELGLHGWVRNRSDGSVEAVFHGLRTAVEEMLKDCHSGPRDAIVESVSAETWSSFDERGFSQLPTV